MSSGTTFAHLLEAAAVRFPRKVAVQHGQRSFSYSQLNTLANRLANLLKSFGVVRGERVAIWLPNCPEFLVAFFGIVKQGAVAVSLNTMLKERELQGILTDCEARLLVTTAALLPVIDGLRGELPFLQRVLATDGENGLETLLTPMSPTFTAPPLEPQASAVIAYTSGTTGLPKGAVHTHANILFHCRAYGRTMHFSSADRIMCALPLYQLPAFLVHAGLAFANGATLWLQEKFEPQSFVRLVEEAGITFFGAVPTIYRMVCDSPHVTRQHFATIRFGICAGAPLPPELRQEVQERWGFPFVHCYGMTETALIVASERIGEAPRATSVGRPLPYMQVRLVGENGHPVSPGRAGEICVGADATLREYFRRPEETQRVLREGWLYTEDVGEMDDDGFLYLIDRKKDVIIRGGFKIYPAEIERILCQDPRVAEAAVIGIPHDRLGEVPKAFIVLQPDARATESDFIELARRRLASYKILNSVEFCSADSLPRNALGKILKPRLRAQQLPEEPREEL